MDDDEKQYTKTASEDYENFLKTNGYKTTYKEHKRLYVAICVAMPLEEVRKFLFKNNYDILTAEDNKYIVDAAVQYFKLPSEVVRYRLSCVAQYEKEARGLNK